MFRLSDNILSDHNLLALARSSPATTDHNDKLDPHTLAVNHILAGSFILLSSIFVLHLYDLNQAFVGHFVINYMAATMMTGHDCLYFHVMT